MELSRFVVLSRYSVLSPSIPLWILGVNVNTIVGVVAMVLYAVTGILLMSLGRRTKDLCIFLLVNICTVLSLFFTFTIFAVVVNLRKEPGTPSGLMVVLVNSLLMLSVTKAPNKEIWQIYKAAMEREVEREM